MVTKLEISEDGKSACCHREVEGGHEIWETELPAVITCQKGLNEPRFASLKGKMAAKKIQISKKTISELGLSLEELQVRVKHLEYLPLPGRPAGKMLEGEPAEQAKELIRLLKEEAKVL